jgi:hypothetical protein
MDYVMIFNFPDCGTDSVLHPWSVVTQLCLWNVIQTESNWPEFCDLFFYISPIYWVHIISAV